MKRGLIESFMAGIFDVRYGERYSTIIYYFIPEYITALLLFSLPVWVDNYFVSCLRSTSIYATLGVTTTLIHLLIKSIEGLSVGTLILTGQFNGADDYPKAGKVLKNAFWISNIVGIFLATFLYFGAGLIYHFLAVPSEMVEAGIRYLQLRAIGIFLIFIYFAFVGFLRGIKNPKIPMIIFAIGAIIFVILDPMLILGYGSIPPLGLYGSAVASIVQYAVMSTLAFAYVLFSRRTRPYLIKLFALPDIGYIREIIMLSWPVIIDKSILAGSYLWLCKIFGPMGTQGLAVYSVIRDMERFSFLPAIALSQVITLLVSNYVGAGQWGMVKSTIKRVLFLAFCMVFTLLLIFSLIPQAIVHIFDKQGDFTIFAAHVFPAVSVLIFCDLIQLILAGALRGAAQVRVVMLTRLVFLLFFIPTSWWVSILHLRADIKFIAIYSVFYLGNAFMSIFYVYWFRSGRWKKKIEVQNDD